MKQTRVAIYTRVSTDDQSSSTQEHELRQYAKNRGWTAHVRLVNRLIWPAGPLLQRSGTCVSSQASCSLLSAFSACPAPRIPRRATCSYSS